MTVSKGFDYTETVGGKPIFRISRKGRSASERRRDRFRTYALEGVSLTLYPEAGSPTVRAEKAQYDHRTTDASWAMSAGPTKGALERRRKSSSTLPKSEPLIPSPVHFSRGTFNVQAKSGRYDVREAGAGAGGADSGPERGRGARASPPSPRKVLYRRDEGVIELAGAVSGSSHRDEGWTATHDAEDRAGGKPHRVGAGGGERARVLAAAPGATLRGPAVSAVQRRYFAKTGALFFGPDGAARSPTLSKLPPGSRKATAGSKPIRSTWPSGGHRGGARARKGPVRVAGEPRGVGHGQLSFGLREDRRWAFRQRPTRAKGAARADKVVQVPGRGLWS
jgi:hypothetical protein